MITLRKIENLLYKNGCDLHYKPDLLARFGVRKKLNAATIWDRVTVFNLREEAIRDPRLKYILLHELGHVLINREMSARAYQRLNKIWRDYNSNQLSRTPQAILDEEKAAWDRARQEYNKLKPTQEESRLFTKIRKGALQGYKRYKNVWND